MCTTWNEHEWTSQQFVEAARHPSMGRYNRFLVRCGQCGRETTMTEWLDLLGDVRSLPAGARRMDA